MVSAAYLGKIIFGAWIMTAPFASEANCFAWVDQATTALQTAKVPAEEIDADCYEVGDKI